jgi:UDP-N-acetylglucosamine--N-acetylmuramyl-(pentapeptide) pyrophosphoryl-undecaprenol N-acetylglucosamine transferase
MNRILFTGGGSAENVIPNIALIEHIRRHKWGVGYLGSATGIERDLMEKLNVPFYDISTGEFDREFGWKSLLDPFLVIMGIVQTLLLCHSYKPDVVFAKGGFVAIPVVIGAWISRIPVIFHESDVKPVLTNRVCLMFAQCVCINYQQTKKFLPRRIRGARTKLTGTPIRQSVLKGNAARGRTLLGLTAGKPVLLILGDLPGSKRINDCVRHTRFQLLRHFQVVHVVGERNLDRGKRGDDGYIQKERLFKEFGDVLAAADLVVSRADANLMYEFLAMRKCHMLIPLSKSEGQGEQDANATIFEKVGMSMVLRDVELTPESMIKSLVKLKRQRKARLVALKKFRPLNAVKIISRVITETID